MTKKTSQLSAILDYCSHGLFLAGLVFMVYLILLTGVVRSQKLFEAAKWLPEKSTSAFAVVDLKDFSKAPLKEKEKFEALLLPKLTEQSWLKGELALARLEHENLILLPIRSQASAQSYLESLKFEGENFTQVGEEQGDYRIYCFEQSQPYCFNFLGNVLVLSPSVESLEQIIQVKRGQAPALLDSPHYLNVHSRLSYHSSAFVYVDMQATRFEWLQLFEELGFRDWAFIDPIWQLYPAMGFTVEMTSEQWVVERFIAVDKSIIGGEALYAHEQPYRSSLMPYTAPDYAFEWSGHELDTQVSRMDELLSKLQASASTLFQSSIQSVIQHYFGDLPLDQFDILLDDEYYFGWTPQQQFMLLLKLDDPDEEEKIEWLLDRVQEFHLHPKPYTLESGEIKAGLLEVQVREDEFYGQRFHVVQAGEQVLARLSIVDNVMVLSSSEASLVKVLERVQTQEDLRSLEEFEWVRGGADEWGVLNMTFLPEEIILSTPLHNWKHVLSSRKHFDDGVFTRHSLLFE